MGELGRVPSNFLVALMFLFDDSWLWRYLCGWSVKLFTMTFEILSWACPSFESMAGKNLQGFHLQPLPMEWYQSHWKILNVQKSREWCCCCWVSIACNCLPLVLILESLSLSEVVSFSGAGLSKEIWF